MRRVQQVGDFLNICFDATDPHFARLLQLVRGLPERKWVRNERCWKVPKDYVVSVVELLEGEGFALDEATQKLYAERRREKARELTVSELNTRVQKALSQAFPLPIWVVGEILDYDKRTRREWVEFKLVERNEKNDIIAQVEAVIFPEVRALIEMKLERAGRPFSLADELTVRVLGQVEVYSEWGVYRLVIRDLDVHYTLAEAARRREEILRRLAKEGILERNRALPFPELPLRVGLITSLGSDAQTDVLNTLRASGFAFQVTVHGARVQGRFTEPSVLNALDWFKARASEFDVILLCRGGGSRADLAWFDSEALARAVALFPIPVVVGIGHEEDRCVLDEVGWRPKPATPSGAAKLLVQRVQETLDHLEKSLAEILAEARAILDGAAQKLGEQEKSLVEGVQKRLAWEHRELRHHEHRLARAAAARLRLARERLAYAQPALAQAVARILGAQRNHLLEAQRRLARATRREILGAGEDLEKRASRLSAVAHRRVAQERERLEGREHRLRALDPKRVVERGFAILRLPCGRAVTDPEQAPAGTALTAELRAGILRLLSQGGERARPE